MQELVEPRLPGRIAFTYPDFTVYQAARFFIVAALEMQSVAVGWQVYEITRRPLDLGLIGLAQFLPGVLLFLVSGHVADRFDRRKLVTLCYCGFALSSGLLWIIAWEASRSVHLIYAVVVLVSISLDMFAVLLGGAVALLPVYASEILKTGPWGLGLLRSAPGVGAAAMAILVAHRPLRRRAGLTMLWCVAGFGICTIIFG